MRTFWSFNKYAKVRRLLAERIENFAELNEMLTLMHHLSTAAPQGGDTGAAGR